MSTNSIVFKKPQNPFVVNGIYTTLDISCDESFNFLGESHPFPEIVYVKSGRVEVVEDDKLYSLAEGDMIYHAAGEFHRIRSAEGSEPNFFILTFCFVGEEPRSLYSGKYSLSDELREEYEKIFDMLYSFNCECGIARGRERAEISASADECGAIGLARLTAFLLELPGKIDNSSTLSVVGGAEAYRRIVKYMERAADNSMTLDGIARELHFSKSYITKLFARFAGIGPMKYFARLRVERIKEKLLLGYGVCDTANLLCFSSPSYMSAFFKDCEGISPSEWLKSER
ncbi:MAG: helix-turn-helix domain-containing protein [Clostridia bacterium]|nr:helix-turn-helix domain-containing protein [Clostridia bacterium]